MSAVTSSLVEIPLESLSILRDYYKVNWPEHVVTYNFLDKMHKRFQKNPEQREAVKIYSVDGKINQDATFIALMRDKDIQVGTLDFTFERLNIGLKLLNFDTKKLFLCVREVYRNAIINFIENSGLNKLFDDGTTMVYMKYDDAINLPIEVPEGLVIRGLSISDVEKVNSVWPFRSFDSVEFLSYCINVNISVGLYDEKSGELLAWCLEHDNSSLLALQVDENHLRKGYATLVTKAITKKIAQERGHDVITNIVHANFKSLGLFEKLNFKKIDKNSWIGVVKN